MTDQQKQQPTIATGFEFEPLQDRNVRIEFFDDDGKTINSQVVTAQVVGSIPLVAMLTEVALKQGLKVAQDIIKNLNQKGKL